MTTTNRAKTVTLGEARDDLIRDALRAVLKELGAARVDASWGVAGCVELETLTVRVGEREVVVEAETYCGIAVTGDEDLVTTIAERVSERVRASAR